MHQKKRPKLLHGIALSAVLFAVVGCPPNGQTLVRSMVHDGIERAYRVFVPASRDASAPTPLLFVLHGGSGDGQRMQRFTRFDRIAAQDGFICVYPDGVGGSWNDGRGTTCHSDSAGVDDVGFIGALADLLAAEFKVDPARVFVCGASNGGMMSFRLACERADLFAAAAPVIANMPENGVNACSPSAPVSILVINGTADPLVPWDGGEVTVGNLSCGTVASTPDSVAFWVGHNGCDLDGDTSWLPDLDPSDGLRVWRTLHGNGQQGTEVVLYGVDGAGHTWPGGVQYLPAWFIGKTTNDINASEVIWEFFKNHPKQ